MGRGALAGTGEPCQILATQPRSRPDGTVRGGHQPLEDTLVETRPSEDP